MKVSVAEDSQRILIFTPFGKDQAHLERVLSGADLRCKACPSLQVLVSDLGKGAGLILTTEEVLLSRQAVLLMQALEQQPQWSAVPLIAFYNQTPNADPFQKKTSHPIQALTDINFLQKPISAAALFSAVRAALRDRNRQYQMRDLLERLEADIEERKRYEEELRKANAASEAARTEALLANRAKSQFLANMSHEIRTPLGVIMGFLELLKSSTAPPSDRIHYMAAIERNSNQLLRLIDDILDLSKVEAGKIAVEMAELSLAEFLVDISSLMTLRAREKGIEFSLDLPGPVPKFIRTDQVRLRQILMNLLGNALKFTHRGKLTLTVSSDGEFLAFKVSDTGIGICPEDASKLFQPFRQADASTTRQFGGTGLGLALSRKLSQALGGNLVLLESTLEKGSIFEATIALSSALKDEWVPTQDLLILPKNVTPFGHKTDRLPGLKVLLVDDSPDNRMLISTYLTRTGAQVCMAEDGLQGVDLAQSQGVDVVLMDIQMPKMDGHEAMKKLRSLGFRAPIVALTAHAMKEERDKCFESGCTDYLTKPISKNHLIDILASYLPSPT